MTRFSFMQAMLHVAENELNWFRIRTISGATYQGCLYDAQMMSEDEDYEYSHIYLHNDGVFVSIEHIEAVEVKQQQTTE